MQTYDTYQPVKSPRLYEQLADQIKERIFHNELKEGQQLPNETELAERFQVSRTVVREAMKRLEQEGFVEVQRGRGTFVVYHAADAVRQSLGNLMEFGGGRQLGCLGRGARITRTGYRVSGGDAR